MKKITVKCNICQVIMMTVEKPFVSQGDTNMLQQMVSCAVDGPIQQYDVDGNPLPKDTSSIDVTVSDE